MIILNECPCLPAMTALRSLGFGRVTKVLSERTLVGLCNVCSDELTGEMSLVSDNSAVGETSVASEFFLLLEEVKRRDPDADCVRRQIFCLSAKIESRLSIVSTVSTEGCLSPSLKNDGSSSASSLSASSPLLSFSRLFFLYRRYVMQAVRPSV